MKYLIFAMVLVLAFYLGGVVSKQRSADLEPPSPVTVSGNTVSIDASSRFVKRLEIMTVSQTSAGAQLRGVGQILALSNKSDDLAGNPNVWVELDHDFSKSAGLQLPTAESAGTAYGLTVLPLEHEGSISVGGTMAIMRYGMTGPDVKAEIVKIIPKEETNDMNVIFRFNNAQDWFPGTNCEVVFPSLRVYPVTIPTIAIIHEGTQEYVWKQVAPHQYEPQDIILLNSTQEEALVTGLHPQDQIIARGAILLKPYLHSLLEGNSYAS